jgi:flavin-dependent dehydrogenase
LPIKTKIQREIDKENDMESTGRYILEFDNAKDDATYFDPDYCIIHLDQDLAPGGYAWVFPKGDNKANIGLGVQHKSLVRRNKRLNRTDTLQSLIENYISSNPVMKNRRQAAGEDDSGNSKGNWQVPVRRQNDCLVANGYLLVGDSAWMPRPIDAGGIGPAIVASVLAGRNIGVALEAKDPSEKMLWTYNTDYVHAYGYQMASFELLRRYLQTLSNEKISYGMKYFLSKDDVQNITKREHPNFGRVNLLNPIMWLRIFSNWDLAVGLRYTAKMSEALIDHNLNYPNDPEKFSDWHKELMRMMTGAFQKFS